MSRIVVNPGTQKSSEFQLKPGTNTIGRGFHNDFQIGDVSVSGSHCEIVVNAGTASIKDLGSTNGTFVNGAQVQQATIADGQGFRLGSVDMVFQADAAAPRVHSGRLHVNLVGGGGVAASSASALKSTGLRLSGTASASTEAAVEEPAVPPLAPPISNPAGRRFCKFHPKSQARFLCRKCNRTFCDLCVSARVVGGTTVKTCRSCGVECVPLEESQGGRAADRRGFFSQLPGAFIYPFRGSGSLILIGATILFAALSFISFGWMSILMKMAALGYLFSYMQNIIHATAAEEREMPSLPEFDGLFGAFFTLAGTVLMSFGIAIGLAAAKIFGEVDAIPASAIIGAVIFGCLYFPMAFLATAMKDTALAANPLIVIPGILKVPFEYIVTVVLMTGIFGVQKVGDLVSSGAGSISLSTRSMSVMFAAFGFQFIWSFISVYLLSINMRILGLLYVAKKEKLAWF